MVTPKQWLDQFHENPFIRLPLSVVVLSKIKNNDFINDRLNKALVESLAFWDAIGIKLQVNVRGWKDAPDADTNLGDNLHDLHRWTIGTPTPTIYVFADEFDLEGGVRGLTWQHNGIAAVGGGGLNNNEVNELIDHELGHLLDLDHQDGTFMRSNLVLDPAERIVTPFQKTKALLNAYEMGGF